MDGSWSETHINRRYWILAVELAVLLIVGSFLLPGGEDLYDFYLPFAGGCLNCGFVPYYALWFLAPLSWLPAIGMAGSDDCVNWNFVGGLLGG